MPQVLPFKGMRGRGGVVDEGFSAVGTPSITGLGAIAVWGGMASAEMTRI